MKHRFVIRLFVTLLIAFGYNLYAYATEARLAADTFVSSFWKTVNFGELGYLYVGNGNTALIQFDLSNLPSGLSANQIATATLTLYVNRTYTGGNVNVAPLNAAWSESSVTFDSLPSAGSVAADFQAPHRGQYVAVNVTSLVKNWVSTPSKNFGLLLSSSSANVLLDSKENSDTSHAPLLDISIAAAGVQGATGPTGPMGPQGLPGIQGPAGPQGAAGPAGAIGPAGPPITFKNTWTSGNTYAIGDAVAENGTSYISLVANNTGNDPGTDGGVHWAVLALKGDTGAAGAAGATGAIGPQGIPGIPGATGPAGANGAPGATGPQGVAGATGPTGPPVTFKGTWNNTSMYAVGDTVYLNGTSYIALASNSGISPPTDTTTWAALALAGATGAPGPAGAPGINGTNGINGATGPAGPAGPAGTNGTGLASAWNSTTAYTTGTLVTFNNSVFLALADSTSIQPGSSAANGIWSGISTGTGQAPAGIPFTAGSHNFTTGSNVFTTPVGNGAAVSTISTSNTAIVPVACTPSLTIYSFGPTGGTFNLDSVIMNSTGISFTEGTSLMSCTVGPSAGGAVQTCTATLSNQIDAGTVLTLNPPAQANSSAFYTAFSCF